MKSPFPAPRLAATALVSVLCLSLSACGGGGGGGGPGDTEGDPAAPPPAFQGSVSFTLPASDGEVFTAGTPITAQVQVEELGQPGRNGTAVVFDASGASVAPARAATAGGRAQTTVQGAQPGTVHLRATVEGAPSAAQAERTLYLRPAPQPLQVLVPAYFSAGTGSDWEWLTDSARAHPDVRVTAILNPTNGLFQGADARMVQAVAQFRAAGGRVIGYVMTGYATGKRSAAAVKANVDNYRRFYPDIDGIFLDEMAAKDNRLDFYREVRAYIRQVAPQWQVVGNPGTLPAAGYAQAADALVTFEGQAVDYRRFDPRPEAAWLYERPNTAQAMLVHDALSCLAMQDAVLSAAQPRNHAGIVYVTDLHYDYPTDTGNPWKSLPSYWEQLLDTVQALNRAQPLPPC